MKKILFIGSLNTKKLKYDGERVKSTIIFDVLKNNFDTSVINLSRHKLFNTLKLFFIGLFCKNKYAKVVLSKDPHGANIIIKIFRFTRFQLSKIYYFEIGPFLYDRIINGTIKKETFDDIKIIVETKSMKPELESVGISVYDIFPNFKHIIDVPFVEQKYPKQVLKLIYFSRIDEMKGIYDLMEVVNDLNKEETIFELDIFGIESYNYDENRFKSLLASGKGIIYKGKIDLSSENEYSILSSYDLHVFPTKYPEGFPGTIIDFFVAGVPTLSSTFKRAYDILSDDDSFFFEKNSKNDLGKKLKYIYNNQQLLLGKRLSSYKRRNEFSVDKFESYIRELLKD